MDQVKFVEGRLYKNSSRFLAINYIRKTLELKCLAAKEYCKPYQTYKLKRFAKTVNEAVISFFQTLDLRCLTGF